VGRKISSLPRITDCHARSTVSHTVDPLAIATSLQSRVASCRDVGHRDQLADDCGHRACRQMRRFLSPFLSRNAKALDYRNRKSLKMLVGVAGFEPATPSSRTRRTTDGMAEGGRSQVFYHSDALDFLFVVCSHFP